MAEQLDPEDWAEIMDDAFDFLIAPIYRYAGTVARLMGDQQAEANLLRKRELLRTYL